MFSFFSSNRNELKIYIGQAWPITIGHDCFKGILHRPTMAMTIPTSRLVPVHALAPRTVDESSSPWFVGWSLSIKNIAPRSLRYRRFHRFIRPIACSLSLHLICWHCASWVVQNFEFELNNCPTNDDIWFDLRRSDLIGSAWETVSTGHGRMVWHETHWEVITVTTHEL